MPRSNSGISKVAAAVIAVVVIIALIIGVYYATLPPGPTPTPATPTPTPKTPTPTTPTPATSTPTPATPTPATPTPTPATPTPTPATPTPTPATPTPATPTLTPTPTTPTPATPTPGPEKIKVGMIASLTGALATVGRVQRIIAEEAVKTINSEDGINVKQYGRKIPIEVVLVDDESNPGRATELAVKLATEGGVVIVVCQSYAFISTPVAKVTERYGIPLLNTSPVEFFAAAGPWNYSWCYATSYLRHVEGFVAFLNNYRGQTNNKVGVVLSDDIIGRTQNQMLTSMLEQAGYTVFNPGLYPPDTTDFAAVIMQLKLANCEILWEHGTPPIFAAFWRQCKMLGYKPKILYQSGGLSRLEEVKALGEDLALGIITGIAWHEDYPFPLSVAYGELWRKYLKEGIDLGTTGAFEFTCWFILKDAIERAGTLDRQAINKAISETNMMGACGPVSYDLKTHTSSGYMSLGQWMKTADGQMVLQPIWSEVAEVKVVKPIFPLP